MRKSTKLAVAFLALAGAASAAAYAQTGGPGGRMDRHGPGGGMDLGRMDSDQNGDVTFEEFAAAMQSRMGDADANKDGKMTVDEVADQIVKMRAMRQAERMIERFDTDGDGALTTAEIESQQKKRFAMLDRNDDGKISKEEMPRRGGRDGGRHGWDRN